MPRKLKMIDMKNDFNICCEIYSCQIGYYPIAFEDVEFPDDIIKTIETLSDYIMIDLYIDVYSNDPIEQETYSILGCFDKGRVIEFVLDIFAFLGTKKINQQQ